MLALGLPTVQSNRLLCQNAEIFGVQPFTTRPPTDCTSDGTGKVKRVAQSYRTELPKPSYRRLRSAELIPWAQEATHVYLFIDEKENCLHYCPSCSRRIVRRPGGTPARCGFTGTVGCHRGPGRRLHGHP